MMSIHLHAVALEQSALARRGLLRATLVMTALTLFGFGLAYALLAAALGQALFPWQANGSVVETAGRPVASALLAQAWQDPRYLQPRPSSVAYDPMAAAGSNLARSNPALASRIARLRDEVGARDGIAPMTVAPDLVAVSGSGLDPHISPAAAEQQVMRIADARQLAPDEVRLVIRDATASPTFGLLGAARVDVLRVNLALDALH